MSNLEMLVLYAVVVASPDLLYANGGAVISQMVLKGCIAKAEDH
jgi:outer membrane murein-binding lipoprotein Lpp